MRGTKPRAAEALAQDRAAPRGSSERLTCSDSSRHVDPVFNTWKASSGGVPTSVDATMSGAGELLGYNSTESFGAARTAQLSSAEPHANVECVFALGQLDGAPREAAAVHVSVQENVVIIELDVMRRRAADEVSARGCHRKVCHQPALHFERRDAVQRLHCAAKVDGRLVTQRKLEADGTSGLRMQASPADAAALSKFGHERAFLAPSTHVPNAAKRSDWVRIDLRLAHAKRTEEVKGPDDGGFLWAIHQGHFLALLFLDLRRGADGRHTYPGQQHEGQDSTPGHPSPQSLALPLCLVCGTLTHTNHYDEGQGPLPRT